MTDQIDKLIAIREQLDELLQAEAAKAEKLDKDLVLAMCFDALTRALPYVRHEGPRLQISGAREQAQRLLRGAA